MYDRLNSSWLQLEQAAAGHQEDDDDDVAEIVHDKFTRDLSREFVSLLGQIVSFIPATGGAPQNTPTAKCGFFMANDEMSKAVLYSLLSCLNWPDTPTNGKSALFLSKLLGALLTDQRFAGFLTNELPQTCLQVLNTRPPNNILQVHSRPDPLGHAQHHGPSL